MRRLLSTFFLGQTVRLGLYAVLGFLAFKINQSGLDVALVLGAQTIAAPLAAVVAGRMVDRFGPRKVLVVSNFLISSLVLLLPLASNSIPLLVVLGLMLSCLSAALGPAARTMTPLLTKDTAKANGKLGAVAGLGYAFGPAAAGITLALGSIWLVTFVLSALALLAGAICLGKFVVLEVADSNDSSESVKVWSVVRTSPRLLAVVIASTILWVGYGLNIPGEVVLANELNGGSVGYAALIAAWGLGSAGGAFFWVARKNLARAVFAGCVIYAVTATISGLAPNIVVAVVSMFVGGVFEGRATTASVTLTQQIAPKHLLGSVFGLIDGLGLAAISLTIFVAGGLIDLTSVRVVYCLAGVMGLVAAATLIPLVKQEKRKLDI